jgi:hypothetical protein
MSVHDWARNQLQADDDKITIALHSQVRPPYPTLDGDDS